MGDVPAAWQNNVLLTKPTAYKPSTGIIEGVSLFNDWYVSCTGQFK